MTESRLQLENLYDLTTVTDVSLSPDGDRVAFVSKSSDRAENERRRSLFVAPTDGSADPYRLTRASDAGSPTWSPDGSKLGFIAGRDEDVSLRVDSDEADEDDDADDDANDSDVEGAGDELKPQVWAFDLERGGDARQLTTLEEGVREFDWSPDGDNLVVSARDPTDDQQEYLRERREENGPIVTERLQHKFDGQGWLDDVTTYLFVVDADTREARRLDDAYGGGASEPAIGLQPAWGPSERIAFVSNRTEYPDDSSVMDVYTVEPSGENCQKLTDSEVTASQLRWNSDGSRLAFVGSNPANWYELDQVYVVEMDDGTYESVSESLDRTVAYGGAPQWVDDSTVVCPIGDEGVTRLVRLHADEPEPERVFEQQGEYRTIAGFDLASDTVALILSQPDEGRDVHTLSVSDLDETDSGPLTRISNVNADLLADVSMPKCERVRFENGDGVEIEGIAYLPPDFDLADPDPHPLIASIHGGPTTYDAPAFSFDYTYWTNRGYVVLRTNYRGSTSYGQEFSEVIRGDWGPRESDDVISGVEALVERGWADPERLCVTGFSQGGINTAYIVTRTDMFAAAAPEHGIYDFTSLFGTGDTHNWYESDLGLPWENPEAYRSISSLTQVDEIDTPMLITAGGNDWRCPPSQAEQLYVSLKKRDIPSKLVVYPDEHHNIGEPERAIHRLRTLTEWFEEHASEESN